MYLSTAMTQLHYALVAVNHDQAQPACIKQLKHMQQLCSKATHYLQRPTLLGLAWSPCTPAAALPPIMGATSLSSRAAGAILQLVLLLAAARRHGAADYAVGDSAGWTIGPNYLTWSRKYNFTAGDTLVFNYVKGQHNVYRVTQDEFRTCEPANHTLGVWATGHDLVNLTVPGDYYFLCNVAGHCLGGMKFSIAVAAPPPPPPPPPAPPALPPPPPPPPSSGGSPWIARRPAWPEVAPMPFLAAIGLLLILA